MKSSPILLFPTIFFTSTVLAQANSNSCNGEIFNNYCCQNGRFSGPVITSFESSISSHFSSLDSSIDGAASSLSVDLSTLLGTITNRDAIVTKAPVLKRAITSEVSAGLTCIGDSVSSIPNGANVVIGGTTASESNAGAAATSSTGGANAASGSSTSSPNAAPIMTQAPVLVAGAAAAVFAYGAM